MGRERLAGEQQHADDENHGDALQHDAGAHQPLRAIAVAALHHVEQAGDQDAGRRDHDGQGDIGEEVGHAGPCGGSVCGCAGLI